MQSALLALVPSFSRASIRRASALAILSLLLLPPPLAAHAQDESGGQNNPAGQQQDPEDSDDPDDDDDGGSNDPGDEEEEFEPVYLTTSVTPARVPITSGTATLTWSATGARYCTVDGVTRATSGSVTVGPWTTTGEKSLLIECYNNGKAGYAASTESVTVYGVPKPVITTKLSKSLLEAGVDKFTVSYSATNATSCMLAGTKYPTSGSATLGPYPVGKHSLTFSCSGDGGSTSHTINWEAIKRVSVSASASPTSAKANGSSRVRVSWTGADADSCTLDGATATKSGSKNFGPYSYSEAGNKSATVSCTNRLGSKSSTATWTVDALSPTVSATLSKNTVTADTERVNLSWTSSNTDSCTYGGSSRATSGTIGNLGPFTAGTHSFTVSCTGTGGTRSDTATLTATKHDPDTDGDGIPDSRDTDDDGDGMPDTWENTHGLNPLKDDSGGDPDGDGDNNLTEYNNGTNPKIHETPQLLTASLSKTRIYENESATFTWSSKYATACRPEWKSSTARDFSNNSDWAPGGKVTFKGSDFDPGTHTYEFYCSGGGKDSARKTIILTVVAWVDTDDDGIPNDQDTDDDGDGMPDVWENTHGLNPLKDDSGGDPDGDGDTNLTEYNNGTDPQSYETPQLLTASLSDTEIYDNESVRFTWSSKYASACHRKWKSGTRRSPSDNGDLGASGTVTYAGADFDPGTHNYEIYCSGGGKNSPLKTLTLEVLAWVDTDGDGTPNDEDTDDDGDGMPDTWEVANKLDPLKDDSGEDPDGDDDSNLTEYRNGTDPQKHEVAQLLNFRLARANIYSDEAAEFNWNSRYAEYCRFSGDTMNLKTSGPLTSGKGDFAAGTWNIVMYCDGPGGRSPEQTVTLTVTDRPGDPDPPVAADAGGFTADFHLYRVRFVNETDGEATLAPQHLMVQNTNTKSNAEIQDFAMKESLTSTDFGLYSAKAPWLTPNDRVTKLPISPVLGDFNHDGYTDLAIVNLSRVQFSGVDRIVYAQPGGENYVPSHATGFDANTTDFFRKLADWTGGLAEVDDDFDFDFRLHEDGDEEAIRGGADAGEKPRIAIELNEAKLRKPTGDRSWTDPNEPPPTSALPAECGTHLRFCSLVYVPPGTKALGLRFSREGFPGTVFVPSDAISDGDKDAVAFVVFTFGSSEVAAAAGGWAVVLTHVLVNWLFGGSSASPPSLGAQDAALLWETILRRVGSSGTIEIGSPEAVKLEELLEEYLGVEVLEGALSDATLENLPELIRNPAEAREGLLGDILTVIEYVRGRLAPPRKLSPPVPPGTVVCEGDHCIPIGCDDDGNCLNKACEATPDNLAAQRSQDAETDEEVKTCLTETDIVEICHGGRTNPEMRKDPRYTKFCNMEGWPKIPLPTVPACSISFSVTPDTAHFELGNANPPVMPTITATATVTAPGANARTPEISWRAQVTHNSPTGCVTDGNVNSPEVVTEWSSEEENKTFSPDFGGIFGGNFTLEASCRDPNRRNLSYASASTSFNKVIRGIEPANANLKTAINSAAEAELLAGGNYYTRMVHKFTGPLIGDVFKGGRLGDAENGELVSRVLKKIACHESHSSQFYSGTGENGETIRPAIGGPRIIGMPVYGGSGDVGIMQACFEREPEHAWNWVENVNRGAFILKENLNRFAYEYLVDQVKPALKINKTDEELTNDERLKIRAEMRKYIREETIHRYNAGGVGRYWKWDADMGMLDDVDEVDKKDGTTETLGYVAEVDGVTSCSLL